MNKQNLLIGVVNGFEIISFEGARNKNSYYKVKCPLCGNITLMRKDGIKSNNSCGCKKGNFTHGLYEEGPMYFMWHDMKNRCYNPKSDHYVCYGERGISVCNEWLHDYESFHKWSILNGWMKGLQIDRIDNDGNYTPKNCRFVTNKVNSRKRQNTVWVELNGEIICLSEACEKSGLNRNQYKSVHYLLHRHGFSFFTALSKVKSKITSLSKT